MNITFLNRKAILWIIPLLLLLLLIVVIIQNRVWGRPVAESAQVEEVHTLEASSATSTDATIAAASGPEAGGALRTLQQPAPTATSTPTPGERLTEAARLHRYGYYTEEQWLLLEMVADAAVIPSDRAEARYRLAESYLAEDNYTQAFATLEYFEQESAALPEDDPRRTRATFLRAETLAGLGRADEAVLAYAAVVEAHPELAEVVYELIAQVQRDAGSHGRAAEAYRRAAETAPDNITRARLLEAEAAMWQAAGSWAAAARVYDEILAFAQNAAYRTNISHQAGIAHAQAGNANLAVERWRAALNEQPENRNAHRALVELVNRNVPVDLFLRGYINVNAEAYNPAVTAFSDFIEANPDDPRVGRAHLGLGQSYIGLGNWNQAIVHLDRVIEEYPECTCFGQAWLDRGRLEILRGDAVTGRRIYRTFAREHPTNALAPEAFWRSALSAISANNQIEAAADFMALVDGFPNSERSPNALYILGTGSMVNRFYPQALISFGRLKQDYPNHERWSAAGYWLGRAHHALGDPEKALEEWQSVVAREPDTYFGVLSGLALQRSDNFGRDIFSGVDQLPNPPSTLAGDDGSQAFAEAWLAGWLEIRAEGLGTLPAEIAAETDLLAGALLLDLGRRGEALRLLERVYNRHQDDPRALYALALHFEELGTYRLSINSASRLMRLSPARLIEDAPVFLQKISYPTHFAELVERESRNHNLDPLLFYSLIRQESLFEEGARSHAAAQGLAQIIPSTGAEIAGRLNYPNYSNALIYRPHINIRFGAFYLDWVRNYVNGDIAAALSGYNAGPGNARRWQGLSGGDQTLFVELITIAEPRTYLYKILSHYYHYNRLYGLYGG
jgi:soluble lytic murein transglycosylase